MSAYASSALASKTSETLLKVGIAFLAGDRLSPYAGVPIAQSDAFTGAPASLPIRALPATDEGSGALDRLQPLWFTACP
jgi:hypothetical protein